MATSPTANAKTGTLTIAGSGIASVKHITLETLWHIKEADKVFYIVCDPVTQAFIQENAKGRCFDLTIYYDKDKSRYDSYVQMAEVMLRDVRAGHDVLGVFYGHPGVFVSPSHRAIAIARDEGYKAVMLPGVSAEDYLFADLGFDPAIPGCMTCEATALLLRDRPLDPFIHNIIWQVGSIGITDMTFSNDRFSLLVDRLEKDFGSNHKVVHYIGAVLPQATPTINTIAIADLRKAEVVKQFNTVSTLYVPPRETPSVDPAMIKSVVIPQPRSERLGTSVRWTDPKSTSAYGLTENNAIAKLDSHVIPDHHVELHASEAVKKFMMDLALNPRLLRDYKANPASVVEGVEGLTSKDKFALQYGTVGPVYKLMEATRSNIAEGREVTEEEISRGVGPSAFQTVVVTVTVAAAVVVLAA